MRRLLLASVLFPACAFADQIPATSRITDVTIYATGARVVREVTFDAPAGVHDLTLDDLPPEVADGAAMRILPGPGVTIGAYALTADGIPTGEPRQSNAQTAADTRVKVLEADERTALAAIDTIATRIDAAEAQAGFLRQLGTGDGGVGTATPQALQDMAAMIGTQTAQIATIRATAVAERRQAEADLGRLQVDLAAARDALAALTESGPGTATVLRVSLANSTGGPGTLQVAYYIDNANWQPVYDIDLARTEGRMTVTRGVVVQQATGEDWTDVDLTLSTARPGEQSAPSTLYADLRRIEPEVQLQARTALDAMMAGAPATAAPVMEVAMSAGAVASFVGDTVVYRYGLPVTLSSGVESLRLSLGTIELTPTIRAIAVPRMDRTAYLQATATNTSDEILLPGTAMLLRDGALIGTLELGILAPGVEFALSFGPIEGLRLSRTLPVRAEAETGILSSSSQIAETATLKIENKTAEAWDVRVLDQVPYSEQEDLEITYTADPEPSETKVEGVRGHLAWDLSLPPGESREIKLDHVISWPEGMVLQ